MPTLARQHPRSTSPINDADGVSPARSDEQLVALLRQGHHGAFDVLVARYQRRLLSFCWRMLRSREDAEDALQDVFAAAFRSLVADDREIHVQPWLYRIARNRCINELRRTRTARVDPLDEHHCETGATLIEKLVTRQQFRELVEDVQALPDTQRTALLLREIDGFAYQQIATAMDTTAPGIKSLLIRARAGLRDATTARDTNLSAPRTALKAKAHRDGARQARGASYLHARAAASRAKPAGSPSPNRAHSRRHKPKMPLVGIERASA